MSIFGPSLPEEPPTWWKQAKLYYSAVQWRRRDSVHVYIPPDGGQVTDDSPGTLRLQLEASASGLRVLDGDAHERGRIDVELPKIRYAIRRDRDRIGTLSARSFVLRRHAVQFASGDRWLFHTPFFLWLGIAGVQNGQVRVLGQVGPNKTIWLLRVDPECDDLDLLTLVALMHRNWWRS